jgi:hypothetical protein
LSGKKQFVCERCMALRTVEFDPKTNLAQCEACGLVFELFGVPVDISPESCRPIGRKREKVSLPKNVHAELHDPVPVAGGTMKATAMVPYREAANAIAEADPDAKRVLRNGARALLRIHGTSERHNFSAFRFVLFGVMLGILEWGCSMVRPRTEAIINTMIVVAILLGGLAVAFVWYLLAAFLNSKTVTLEDGVLRVNVGPIPMGGNHAIVAEDIVQIWTRKTIEVHQGKSGSWTEIAYNVELRLKKGEPLVLLRDLREQDQALYIEQTLEHALGIIDVAVVDEDNPDAFLR